MRKNEWTRIEQFTSQYVGEWAPSDGHWLGLDFLYHGIEYRFQTGAMFTEENTILPDGREAVFGIYVKDAKTGNYTTLGEFASMEDVLNSTCILNTSFSDVILDTDTELLGQD